MTPGDAAGARPEAGTTSRGEPHEPGASLEPLTPELGAEEAPVGAPADHPPEVATAQAGADSPPTRKAGSRGGCLLLSIVVAMLVVAFGVRAMNGYLPWDPAPGPIEFGTAFAGDALELDGTVTSAPVGRTIVFDAHLSRFSAGDEQLDLRVRLRDTRVYVTLHLPADDQGGDEVLGRLPSFPAGAYEVEVADPGGQVLARGSILLTDTTGTPTP